MRSIEHAFEPRIPSRRLRPARLTRRGRAVVVLLALALLVLAGFTLGRVSSQAAAPSRPLPTVTVHAGETLWDIAGRVAPHADRRALVLQIEQLNHLAGGGLVAGQQLRLPRNG
jgi:Tfp pilus assembly protein FimV